ncbi:GntR family transcriptional regulator [Plantactinospora sp. BB1]|uniref:GntR family transcriptional regulator n=1 Tax=Plantactinospora sp. BB1 TaxID=2071627 RepID=UPI000D172006|nr:GntR family transcriptional regulator [Plantactinospora sp. BB1]AVT34656.1 GntR family transcriptional regulator [Plantactinospora sp. BC1]AVT41719.1 GntR family transcriptional regulator [Plantactinospora sp. BB1]
MIIEVDPNSEVPIYQQLRDRVVEAIASGALREGSPLPSTRALATDFGINFHTVNKGYDLLRQQRLLRINRKSGAVVLRDAHSGPPAPEFVADWTGRATTLLAEATAHGLTREEVLEICRTVLTTFDEGQEESR